MKVGTDGVLLGAWASHPGPKHILDVGSGTGLIALMLAQRYPQASITAIEPHEGAYNDAVSNFERSPFKSRIQICCTTVQDFTSEKCFDMVVSNPPFYTQHLPPADAGRHMARHALSLDPSDLTESALRLLKPAGVLCGIYPLPAFKQLMEKAGGGDLRLISKCYVHPLSEKPAHRVLFAFRKNEPNCGVDPTFFNTGVLVIEEKVRHKYTDGFTALVKDFYLNL